MELIGLVLAGGKSSRMREDKGAIRIHGKSQIENCLELLRPFCSKVYVSRRAGQERTREVRSVPSEPTLSDAQEFAGIGPMSGLLTAFKQFPNCAILAVAIDLPLLDADTLKFLIDHRNPAKSATVFISSSDGFPEPLCAIYEPAAYPLMLAFKDTGKSCPRKFLINHDTERLQQPNPESLFNMNTPGDLEAILPKLKDVR